MIQTILQCPVVTLVASDPEHRPTEIGEVHDADRAADRTAVRATKRGPAVAVEDEHPRRGRDITGRTTTWGITAYLAPAILTTAAAAECITWLYCITLTTTIYRC